MPKQNQDVSQDTVTLTKAELLSLLSDLQSVQAPVKANTQDSPEIQHFKATDPAYLSETNAAKKAHLLMKFKYSAEERSARAKAAAEKASATRKAREAERAAVLTRAQAILQSLAK